MIITTLLRSPVAHRSGTILAAAFLLLAGAPQAGAAPSSSSSGESSAASSAPSACPDEVRITLGKMTVSGGMVTIPFTSNAHDCRPTVLHIHQNLLMSAQAGSDPDHQWNADLSIGPSHGDGVTVPLLESADGKCFVQVDAHASGHSRGQFFPTTTCALASPSMSASSSTPPSTPASSSTTPSTPASSSTAPSTPASSSIMQTPTAAPSSSAAPSTTSQSVLPESSSRSTASSTFSGVGQVQQPPSGGSLAATGSRTAVPVGVAALLVVAGAWLMVSNRRPRRH